MTDRKMVTMKDIATLANVTTQTVSRALSDSDNVHPETKKKVLEIAKQLNYIKNSNASILRSGSSKIIAVFYDNLKNLFFSLMSDFLYNNFKKYGYTIMTIPVFNPKLNMEMYKYALSLNVAGIISFLECDEELSKYLSDNRFPLIVFGRKSDYKYVDYIALDDDCGGRLAAKELLKENGKEYLYVSESIELEVSMDRFKGYQDELKKNGYSSYLIDVSKTSIDDGLDKLFKDGKKIDSVFCFNDMLAFGVIRYYEKHNYPKPNIVGFDALSNEIMLPCELKSIGVEKEKMASIAAKNLVSKIERNNDEEIALTMPVNLYK